MQKFFCLLRIICTDPAMIFFGSRIELQNQLSVRDQQLEGHFGREKYEWEQKKETLTYRRDHFVVLSVRYVAPVDMRS